MRKWGRRIKAAIGLGIVWGAAWLIAGLILLAFVGVDAADVPFPLFFGFLGFLAGAAFSLVLGVLGRRRRFDQMSLPRFAGWGALGGLLISVVVMLTAGNGVELMAVLAPVFATAGAISATGTLALARRTEDRQLLDVDTDPSKPELSAEEKRELLGGRNAR